MVKFSGTGAALHGKKAGDHELELGEKEERTAALGPLALRARSERWFEKRSYCNRYLQLSQYERRRRSNAFGFLA
jgi:hypothetical protein